MLPYLTLLTCKCSFQTGSTHKKIFLSESFSICNHFSQKAVMIYDLKEISLNVKHINIKSVEKQNHNNLVAMHFVKLIKIFQMTLYHRLNHVKLMVVFYLTIFKAEQRNGTQQT